MARKEDQRISRLYTEYCHGIQIPVMQTIEVMAVAKQALAKNPEITDMLLGTAMRAYVDTVRTN